MTPEEHLRAALHGLGFDDEPAGRMVGFGSIPRALQALAAHLRPRSVVVTTIARHMCVEMRGSRTPARVRVEARRPR